MLDDIRFTYDDRFRREQNMSQLCTCKEQTKTKLFDLSVPGLGIQHSPAEVEDNPLLIVMLLNQNRGDGSVTHGQVHVERPVLSRRDQYWRLQQIFFDFIKSPLLFCPPVKLILGLDLHQTHERLDTPKQIGDKSSDKVDFADELL